MPRASATFKKYGFVCLTCGADTKILQWNYDPYPFCPCNGQLMEREYGETGKSATVIGDEIDVMVTDGPCNPDGTPRRYRSRAELASESAALGWQREGDTPHPECTDWKRR